MSQKDLESKWPSIVAHAVTCVHNQMKNNPDAPVSIRVKEADGLVKKRKLLQNRFHSLDRASQNHATARQDLQDSNTQLGVKSDHQTEVIQTQTDAIQNQTVVIESLIDAVNEMKSEIHELRLQVSQNTSASGLKRKRIQSGHPVILVSVHMQLICPKKATSTAGHRTSTGGYDA